MSNGKVCVLIYSIIPDLYWRYWNRSRKANADANFVVEISCDSRRKKNKTENIWIQDRI